MNTFFTCPYSLLTINLAEVICVTEWSNLNYEQGIRVLFNNGEKIDSRPIPQNNIDDALLNISEKLYSFWENRGSV